MDNCKIGHVSPQAVNVIAHYEARLSSTLFSNVSHGSMAINSYHQIYFNNTFDYLCSQIFNTTVFQGNLDGSTSTIFNNNTVLNTDETTLSLLFTQNMHGLELRDNVFNCSCTDKFDYLRNYLSLSAISETEKSTSPHSLTTNYCLNQCRISVNEFLTRSKSHENCKIWMDKSNSESCSRTSKSRNLEEKVEEFTSLNKATLMSTEIHLDNSTIFRSSSSKSSFIYIYTFINLGLCLFFK